MKQTQSITLTLLLTIMLLHGCSFMDQPVPPTAAKVVAVQVAKPSVQDMVETLRYPCQMRPAMQVYVTSKLAGKVSEVFYDLADFVNEGEPLFSLDTTDIMNNIRVLQAQIATADAAVNSATTGVRLATGSQLQAQILQATGSVTQAGGGVEQANIALAQSEIGLSNAKQSLEQAQLAYDDLLKDYDASLQLYEFGELTKRQLEQLELGLEQTLLRLNQAELGLEQAALVREQAATAVSLAEQGLELAASSFELITTEVLEESQLRAEDMLAQAMAQRDALVAQLMIAESALSDSVVRAPVSGIVAARGIERGMMLGQSTMAFTIIDVSKVYAYINVSESLISKLNVGDEIEVNISAVTSKPFLGHIEVISPAAGAGAVFEVRIAIDNSSALIKPGMYADVFVVSASEAKVLVIPLACILEDSHSKYVYVVREDIAIRTRVSTGIANGENISILDGLRESDFVVVRGQRSITDGATVAIASSTPQEGG